MKFWSFFDPKPDLPPSAERAPHIVVVKEGFAWLALLMPLLWLLWHRLWWETLFVLVVFVAVGVAASFMPVSPLALMGIHSLMNLAIAFIGNDLRCAKLERNGYEAVAVLQGNTQLEAEALFFDTWGRPEKYGAFLQERGKPLPAAEAV